MTDYLEIDRISREKIANEINKNFFVEAGAGSGKTYSLVQRMVAMILSGIDVRKICAITFTKAAANEFYSRFHEALVEKANEDITPEQKTLIEDAIKNIDLCFMGTIDSFCNMILSEHPAIAGVPANSSITSDDEMKELFVNEFSKIASGDYGDELKAKYEHLSVFHYDPKAVFISGLEKCLDTRNASLVYEKCDFQSIDEKYKNEKREYLAFLKFINEHQEYIAFNTKANPTKFVDIFNDAYSDIAILEHSWERDYFKVQKLIKAFASVRINPEYANEVASRFGDYILFEELKKAWYYRIAFGADNKYLEEIEELKFSVAMDFVESSISIISDSLRKTGKLSFFDYLLYLRDMLKMDASGDGKLIKHIYDRHSYFLIDEFQDTNPMQAEVFFYLSAEKPVENWRECVPKPGSLFIVGDPKQSIYRFRNADVASYLSVKDMFKGEVGEVLQLCKNFRSTKQICTWFNDAFSILLPDDTDIQSKYALIPADQNDCPDGTFGGVYYYTTTKSGNSIDFDYESKSICNIISTLVNNPKHLIYDKGKNRRIEYKDFMIITPGKGHIKDYVRSLNEIGVPTFIEGAVSFSEVYSLKLLSHIISALANPNNSTAVYKVLRSSLYSLTDEEIEIYRLNYGKISIYSTKHIDGCERIEAALNELRTVFDNIEELSIVSAINTVKNYYKLFEITGADELDLFYYVMELIQSAECANQLTSLEEGASFLHDIVYEVEKQERASGLEKDANRVHIANLHKVKGLEAPIVICACPSTGNKTVESYIEDDTDGKKQYVFTLGNGFITTNYADKKDEEARNLDAEKIRLLYVAATRAKEALIIANCIKEKDGTQVESNPWYPLIISADSIRSLDDTTLDGYGDYMPDIIPEEVFARDLYSQTEKENAESNTLSVDKTYSIKRPSNIKIKAKTISDDEFKDGDSDDYLKNYEITDAAFCGTLVHRLMEILVSSRNTVNIADAIKDIVLDYSADENMQRMLHSVAQKIISGGYEQQNDLPADILDLLINADEVYCEVPFCHKKDNELWNGVIDVVYKKDNTWHIIDYKTNAEINDIEKKYEDQLSAYIEAFKTITGNDADAKIYHIDI